MEGPGFITVKYGDDEHTILNTWCPSHVLLKYCLKKCYGENEVDKYKHLRLDLMDTTGTLRGLTSHPHIYAHNFITPRETYILVKIECKDDDDSDRYTSLLKNIGTLYPKVKAKLDELSQYKVSGKVGARWAKIKTISKFSTLGKSSSRSQQGDEKSSARGSVRGSNASLDRVSSAKSERSSKANRKLIKEAKTKKNAKS